MPNILTRRLVIYMVMALVLSLLILEIGGLLPSLLARWHPWDYGNYIQMGRAVREGTNPYGSHSFYPLPTMLWIFVPLSLAPDWFRFAWVLLPFLFVLILFRKDGLFLFLFPPLWFVVTDAMFDAWLLFPLVWLFGNRRTLAPIGAALVLFKPHVTALVVAYMLARWLFARDTRSLAIFLGVMSVLWIPPFFVDPIWPMKMLAVLPERVGYISILPLVTTSITSWWSFGGIALVGFAVLAAATVFLLVRGLKRVECRSQTLQLVQLLASPVTLASNLITVLPTLRERNEIIVIAALGLVAYVLNLVIGFGGWYTFIPLTALYFQTRRSVAPAT